MEASLLLKLQTKTLLACSTPPPPRCLCTTGMRVLYVEYPSEGGNSPLSIGMLTKPNQEKLSPNTKVTSLKKKRQV